MQRPHTHTHINVSCKRTSSSFLVTAEAAAASKDCAFSRRRMLRSGCDSAKRFIAPTQSRISSEFLNRSKICAHSVS